MYYRRSPFHFGPQYTAPSGPSLEQLIFPSHDEDIFDDDFSDHYSAHNVFGYPAFCSRRQRSHFPSTLELLELQEKQLLLEQQQLAAQRKQIAQERAARQKAMRERELRHQQYLAEQKERERQRLELLAQHREQQKQQLKRQALQDYQRRLALQQRRMEEEEEENDSNDLFYQLDKIRNGHQMNPFEILEQLFYPKSNAQKQTNSRSISGNKTNPQVAPTAPKVTTKTLPEVPSSSNQASSSSSVVIEPAKQQTPKKTGPSKSSLRNSIASKIAELTEKVQHLLNTSFSELNLKKFAAIDNELMQLLLTLDGLNTDPEVPKNERRDLIRRIIKLLETVDEYKEQYSSSSEGEASDSDSVASDSAPEIHNEETAEVPAESSNESSETQVPQEQVQDDIELEPSNTTLPSESTIDQDEIQSDAAQPIDTTPSATESAPSEMHVDSSEQPNNDVSENHETHHVDSVEAVEEVRVEDAEYDAREDHTSELVTIVDPETPTTTEANEPSKNLFDILSETKPESLDHKDIKEPKTSSFSVEIESST